MNSYSTYRSRLTGNRACLNKKLKSLLQSRVFYNNTFINIIPILQNKQQKKKFKNYNCNR